jgi:hypothetical protein
MTSNQSPMDYNEDDWLCMDDLPDNVLTDALVFRVRLTYAQAEEVANEIRGGLLPRFEAVRQALIRRGLLTPE